VPDLSGGHYFLTVLAPIHVDADPHEQLLAEELARLPTGRQTMGPEDSAPSPFSRNTLNHTARLVMIDSPRFNGRVSGDTLLSVIRKVDPLKPQPADRFPVPFLLFAADIDAPGGDGEAALKAYTHVLWETMKGELRAIFGHCVGYEAVADAASFHAYIKRCQVETTLPFNDYWAHGLQPPPGLPLDVIKKAATAVALATVAAVGFFVVMTLLNAGLTLARVKADGVHLAAAWSVALLLGVLAVAALGVLAGVIGMNVVAARGLPAAPGSDLPSVLKALFVQQNLTRFAIEAQGLDDQALHDRFGAFLDAVRLQDAAPSLAAGECHAPHVEWAR